jgi:hypothetical protein
MVGLEAFAQTLLQLGSATLTPSPEGYVVHKNAPFGQDFFSTSRNESEKRRVTSRPPGGSPPVQIDAI